MREKVAKTDYSRYVRDRLRLQQVDFVTKQVLQIAKNTKIRIKSATPTSTKARDEIDETRDSAPLADADQVGSLSRTICPCV